MGVTPPDFVVQAARKEEAARSSCCKVESKSCCSSSASCCTKPQKSCCATPKTSQSEATENAGEGSLFSIVLIQDYRKCRGMVEQFFELLSAVVIAPRVEFETGTVVAELSFTSLELDSTEAVEPAVPPP